jgi:hypothetical protein
MLRFVAINDYGNQFYMDNVNIKGDNILANHEVQENQLLIYPNPNNGTFSIFSNYDKLNYIVYNLLGEKIKSGNLNYRSNKIEMPGLKSGIYLIVFKNRETTINKKVTIY